jgi:hypothetical protein
MLPVIERGIGDGAHVLMISIMTVI